MNLAACLRRLAGFGRDERGATAIIVALSGVMLIGMMGLVVDVGRVMVAQRALQASTDAAALAGAYEIPSGTAVSTAITYSATSGQKNASAGYTTTMISGYPLVECLTSTGITCVTVGAQASANAIQVKQQTVVPMFFAQVFGVNTMTVTAVATAGARGGQGQALDVMVIVDTTASMNTVDNNCSITGATRLQCALAGMTTLLRGLNSSTDHVGLMVFPGLTGSSYATNDLSCTSMPSSAIAAYSAAPVYQIVALGNDFKSSSSSSLSSNSNIVKAAAPGSGCTNNLKAVGGVGTFYSDVITSAQSTLAGDGRSNTQKVIIFLSDGDANASTAPSSEAHNQCHEAMTAAQNAATAGAWVYSIAYGSDTSSSTSCSTDSPSSANPSGVAISACHAMKGIASDATKFYSDDSGGTGTCAASSSYSDLVSLFSNLSSSLQEPRLLPDNTT